MECYYIDAKYIDSKNITFKFAVNQYNMLKSFGENKAIKLVEIIEEITDGTRAKREYTDGGVRIINISDFKNGNIYPYNIKTISKSNVKEKDFVKEGDILISAIGRSGQLAIIDHELQDCVISSDVIRVRLKDVSKAQSVVAYLNSKHGQLAIESIKNGVLNRISVSDVKDILLPQNFNELSIDNLEVVKHQKHANKIFEECTRMLNKYLHQEEMLFETLKFAYVDVINLNMLRLDPFYYFYYESELYKYTHRDSYELKWQCLKDVVEIKTSAKPEFDEDAITKYINLSNIDSDLSVIKNNEIGKFSELSSRIRYLLNMDEVLTAKVGSATGTENHITAVVTSKYSNMMASDAFFNMIPRNIDPYYLLFLFKQPIILKQIEGLATGLYFKSMNKIDFENIRVPRIVDEDAIAVKMREYVNILEEYYGQMSET